MMENICANLDWNPSREIGRKPSQEFRNITLHLLSLVLLDDRVKKLLILFHFVLLDTSRQVDSLDSVYTENIG